MSQERLESDTMSLKNDTKGAEDLDGGVLVGDAELRGVERNVSEACRNCETEVRTTGVGGMGTRAVLGVDRLWRRRWARCVDARLVDFGVFNARTACVCFSMVGNAFTTWGNCLSARGNAIVGTRGKKTLHMVKLSSADCWTWRTCAGAGRAAEATSMDEGPFCFSGNIAAAFGGVWNNGDASEDETEGGKMLRGIELKGAESLDQRALVSNAMLRWAGSGVSGTSSGLSAAGQLEFGLSFRSWPSISGEMA